MRLRKPLIKKPIHHTINHAGGPLPGRPLRQMSSISCLGRKKLRIGTNQAPIVQPAPQRR
jgi:hypothetical protein